MTVRFSGRRAAHARRVLEHLEMLRGPTCGVCEEPEHELALVDTEEHGRCCAECVAECACGERWPRVTLDSRGRCPGCVREAAEREDEQGELEVDSRATCGGPRWI
jgi:hypothetical protein